MYEQLGRLGQDGARWPTKTGKGCCAQRDDMEAGRAQTLEEVVELETRLRNAQEAQQVHAAEPSSAMARQQIAAAAETARGVEVEARLAVRTAEERANAVRGRADSLRRAAAAEREATAAGRAGARGAAARGRGGRGGGRLGAAARRPAEPRWSTRRRESATRWPPNASSGRRR